MLLSNAEFTVCLGCDQDELFIRAERGLQRFCLFLSVIHHRTNCEEEPASIGKKACPDKEQLGECMAP